MNEVVKAPNPTPKGPATTVFLVEDSVAVRDRLLGQLREIPGVEVIGHAERAADAIDKVLCSAPAAVVLDLKLKEGNGLQVLHAIKKSSPGTKVIILTNHSGAEIRQVCLNAGADHFLDKTNEYQNIPLILKRPDKCQNQENASC